MTMVFWRCGDLSCEKLQTKYAYAEYKPKSVTKDVKLYTTACELSGQKSELVSAAAAAAAAAPWHLEKNLGQ
ncbi:hypothetical protein M0804_001750 [Polistes exclamans]|nr:hypothetical protein M0804_001750 [Polistes exclamans]